MDLRDKLRRPLFAVDVDVEHPPTVVRAPASVGDAGAGGPAGDESSQITLDWEQAFDDEGHLRKCPACNCRELFVRKDFPQAIGFTIVVLAAVAALILFASDRVLWGAAVLASVVVIDGVIYLFTGRCLVCYRCRSEFRDLPIGPEHEPWELATGEKYRLKS